MKKMNIKGTKRMKGRRRTRENGDERKIQKEERNEVDGRDARYSNRDAMVYLRVPVSTVLELVTSRCSVTCG